MNIKIKLLNADAVIPKYAHEYDAGVDLVATEDVIVEPGETKLIPTGLAFEIPPGYEMQIRSRSGVTLKTKLRVQLGTVDAGYRGEVGVIVDNIARKGQSVSYVGNLDYRITYLPNGESKRPFNTYIIRKGDRIAQAVIAPIEHATFVEVDSLDDTDRGSGGFGSTGVNHPEYFAVPMGNEII